jgi:trehalose-6-phosphate synthase
MSEVEQTARMRQMRDVVSRTDTYWWAEQLLRDAKRMSGGLHLARDLPHRPSGERQPQRRAGLLRQ